MKAIRFNLPNKKLALENIAIPKISALTDVLVKVAYCGICGTDLHIMEGEFPVSCSTVTLGHELCGRVEQVGSNVKTIKIGDRIAVDPNSGCDSCKACHEGKPHFCQGPKVSTGLFRDGGFAEYCLVYERQCHKLPESVSFQQGAFTEPMSCICHGWDLLSPVPLGLKILVLGGGIIGSLFTRMIYVQGHRNITVSEPNKTRLNVLEKLGFNLELVTPEELKQKHDADPEYVFDLIMECAGYPPAIEHAVNLLNKGGKLCCFGVSPPGQKIKIEPSQIFIKELTILGTYINPYTFPKAISVLETLGEKLLNYDSLDVGVFRLDDYKDAFYALRKGCFTKAMFKCNDL